MNNKKKIFYQKRYPFSAFFFVFIILMYNNANTISQDNFKLVALALILIIKSKVLERRLLKKIYIVCLIFSVFLIASIIIFRDLPSSGFVGRHLSFIIISFSILHMYKDLFFVVYEKVLFYLVSVSLVLFTIQLINYNIVSIVVRYFDKIINYNNPYSIFRPYYANMLIYTINNSPGPIFSMRNCGFLYEPGFFSIFISIALL
ncbi:MAG: hypothetical protein KKA19_04550, partial [Candidatus Margulisbacteria bacterium]|nr:hypothetical protein [Candidatus Margulisiibacteriota bacterium]